MKTLDALVDVKATLVAKFIAVFTAIALVLSCFTVSGLAFAAGDGQEDGDVQITETTDNATSDVPVISKDLIITDDPAPTITHEPSTPGNEPTAGVSAPSSETPQAVKDFLDAVAALPSVDSVTAENAEAVGDQVNAIIDMWEALDSELADRDDVTAAMDTAYALFYAVLAAGNVETPETFNSDPDVVHTLNIAKGHQFVFEFGAPIGAFVSISHNQRDWSLGSVVSGNSAIATASGWFQSQVGSGNYYCKVGTSYMSLGGYQTHEVTINAKNVGETYVDVIHHSADYYNQTSATLLENLHERIYINVYDPETEYVNNISLGNNDDCLVYVYDAYGDPIDRIDFEEGGTPHCISGNDVVKVSPPAGLSSYTDLYDDEIGCAVVGFNVEGLKTGNAYIKSSYGSYEQFVTYAPTIYGKWVPITMSALNAFVDVWKIVVEESDEPTYTVTYTDGVNGETVFPDQSYEGLKEGDATPAFVGTPTRDDYTFMGWTPAVKSTVDPTMANDDNEIIYTANWKEKEPIPPTPTPTPELSIAKSVDKTSVKVGETVTYTINVANAEEATAATENVKIKDVLDSRLQWESASYSWTNPYDGPDDGMIHSNYAGTGTISTQPTDGLYVINHRIAPGGTFTLTIVAKVVESGTIENTATVPDDGDKSDKSDPVDAKRAYNVTINFKTDEGDTLQDSIVTPVEEGSDFSYTLESAGIALFAAGESGVTEVVIPSRIGDYVLDEVASAEGLKKLAEAQNITADIVADIIYSKDVIGGENGGYDGIPDKYQVTVTFKAVNGTFAGTLGTGKTELSVVLTKVNADGKNDVNGTARLVATQIPYAKANEGYAETGTWKPYTPSTRIIFTKDMTFTITFDELIKPDAPTTDEINAMNKNLLVICQDDGAHSLKWTLGWDDPWVDRSAEVYLGEDGNWHWILKVTNVDEWVKLNSEWFKSNRGLDYDHLTNASTADPLIAAFTYDNENSTWSMDYNPIIFIEGQKATYRWLDASDNELQVVENHSRCWKVPEFNGELPTKDPANGIEYEFAGWAGPTVETADDGTTIITYTPAFHEKDILVSAKWVDGYTDGPEIQIAKVAWNISSEDLATLNPADPIREGYNFIGWSEPVISENGDKTITALWEAVTPVNPEPTPGPVTPVPGPIPTPTPTPINVVVPLAPAAAVVPVAGPAPAAAVENIADDATPMAQAADEADEEMIQDEETPMSAFDTPHCWVHIWMIIGMILTAVYGVAVLARRKKYTKDLDDFESDVLGEGKKQTQEGFVPAGNLQTM